jgi:D-inositol-3-phosphate glycosyltransferase
MRIAFVNDQGSPLTAVPGWDEPQAWQMALAKTLAQQGHTVRVYARQNAPGLPGREVLPRTRVAVEHLAAGPPRDLPPLNLAQHAAEFGARLTERWRRYRPAVVHAQSWTSGLAALVGRRDLGVPVVQTFASPPAAGARESEPRPGEAAEIRMQAAVARTVHGIVATCSSHILALARLGVPRAQIKVVPCGVDTQRFAPHGDAAPRGGRPRLLAAGPLTGRQGLGILLMALADVPDAELVIAGSPPPPGLHRAKNYQALAGLARKLRVADRVIFTSLVRGADLAELLRSADLLVSAAWYDPVGATALQAMACGIPVVVTEVGALADAVIDQVTGLLVPPGQPGLLASRIRWLLARPALRAAYSAAAVDRARSRYSWNRIGQETVAAYQDLQAQVPQARHLVAPPCAA